MKKVTSLFVLAFAILTFNFSSVCHAYYASPYWQYGTTWGSYYWWADSVYYEDFDHYYMDTYAYLYLSGTCYTYSWDYDYNCISVYAATSSYYCCVWLNCDAKGVYTNLVNEDDEFYNTWSSWYY